MKTKKIIAVFLLMHSVLLSQKMTPNVDLISEIVAKKQDEIKQRFLKNLIVKNIHTTNNATYNTMYYLMDVLTTEKNKTVMSKNIIELVANYSVSYFLANDFIESGGIGYSFELKNNNNNNYLSEIINSGFKPSSSKDKNSDIFTNSPTMNSIIGNYVVDQFYLKLLNLNEPIFIKNGLFRKDLKDEYFEDKEVINYGTISKEIKDNIDSKISEYLKTFQSKLQAGDTNLNFIKKLADLKKIPKEDIQKLFELFISSLDCFKSTLGNSFLYKIGFIINKYVIYDFNENDENIVFNTFKIDVEAIISDVESSFFFRSKTALKNHKVGFKPFFTIGLNYSTFLSESSILADDGTSELNDVSFVGEKIGVKMIVADFAYARSHKPKEAYLYRGTYRRWNRPKATPLVSNVYFSLYGSGILYNVVDLKSKNNFNFGLIAFSGGIAFFNDLELNVSYATPIINKSLSYENSMIVVGFDIPIFEYLGALKKNKQ